MTGPVPAGLGNLRALRFLFLSWTGLTGPLPDALANLENLERLSLSGTWGLSGPLPSGLRLPRLQRLHVDLTQTCAPAAWRDWLETIDFEGRLCETGTDVTVDVAVVYTPAAREWAGGTAAIEADIDLIVALTNQAYAASGVHHRVALVARTEVPYVETGNSYVDVVRLDNPSDGHMDGVHALRDRVGADLVHLMVGRADGVCGRAFIYGAFGLSVVGCGSRTVAHELGHNMGLQHDRYQVHHYEGGLRQYPAYGYVNQGAFAGGATRSSHWYTIMAYPTQCNDAYTSCFGLLRFSNPRQGYDGDPLGVPFGAGGAGVTGPSDAAAVLNATGPAVASWRDRPAGANQPPVAVGTLPDRELTLHGTLDVDVSPAFVDPDGDALRYTVASSTPDVVTVLAAGASVTLTAVGEGTASIRVTATDPGGLSATQLFAVTVTVPANLSPEPVGALAPLRLGVDESPVAVDAATAFRDPDGDPLIYWAGSSAPGVATVAVTGSRVTVMPVAAGEAAVTVTATDPGGLSALQTFAVTVSPPANRPPEPVGVLAPVTLGVDDAAVTVDVAAGFRDPDGDTLTYGARSSAPGVATAAVSGSTVTVTPVAPGTATVTVTATDTGGSNTPATQTFAVTVPRPFTDHRIVPGVTPVKAIHFTESRARIDVLRREAGLAPFPWTDRVLTAGVTPVRLAHLLELREALGAAYAAAGRTAPGWTDAGTGKRCDPDPGGAPDGAARRGDGAGVRRGGRPGTVRPRVSRDACGHADCDVGVPRMATLPCATASAANAGQSAPAASAAMRAGAVILISASAFFSEPSVDLRAGKRRDRHHL